METNLIPILSIPLLLLSTFLFYRASGQLDPFRLNTLSFTYYSLLIMSAIGAVFIGMGIDRHRVTAFIVHPQTRLNTWGIIMALMIVIPLLWILYSRVMRFDPKDYQKYLSRPIHPDPEGLSWTLCLIMAVISIVAVIYVMVQIGLENNPILAALRGEEREELQRLRIAAGAGFPGNHYIKNLLAILMTQFASLITLVNLQMYRKRRWLLLFVALFLAASLMCIYNLEKAPILKYLLTLMILIVLMGAKIKTWQKLLIVICGVAAVLLMYLVFADMQPSQLLSLEAGPINRLFITSSIGSFLHLEAFTYVFPKLGGQSLHRILSKGLLGFDEVVRSGRVIMEYTNPEGVKKGIAGVFNALFIGEAYANFGYWGIFLSTIWISLIFFAVHYLFVEVLSKNPANLALFAYLSFNLPYTLHGGFADYVVNSVWFFVIGVTILYNMTNKILGGPHAEHNLSRTQ
ncbi:MAG: O-antigen polymerase [Tissierellia bacterium]|nr:O-antigen polymerase [Tissierellia bacterium]